MVNWDAFAQIGLCDAEHIPHPDVCSNKDAIINRLYVQRDR